MTAAARKANPRVTRPPTASQLPGATPSLQISSKKIAASKKIYILCSLRKLAAIVLIGVLFFNWYGYQLLSAYWEQRENSKLEASLDRNDYDESQLVSLKVPVTNLSYYNSSTTFERVDGTIDVNGVQYKYVKRRIYKDSLELLCIPNLTAMKLRQSKNDFFRQVNDLQQQNNHGKKHNSTTRDVSKDYAPAAMDITVPALVTASQLPGSLSNSPYLPSSYVPTAEMPPDALS